jgi:hypothetical protein
MILLPAQPAAPMSPRHNAQRSFDFSAGIRSPLVIAYGLGVDSTSPASRLHMSRGATYRWLVRNAGRFGFVPYAFEPWHWEWVSPAGGYTGPPPPT